MVLLAVFAALTACANTGDPKATTASRASRAELPAGGRSFLSTEVTENGVARELIAGTQIWILFGDRLSASAGCNTLSGRASDDNGRLVVGDILVTEIGCEPFAARHGQDKWLESLLRSQPHWTLQGTRLTLDNGSTRVLMEDRKVSQPDRALRGTRWVVYAIDVGNGGMSSIPSGVEAYLELTDGQRLLGSGGCNTLNGGAAVDERALTITFSDIRTETMGCDEAHMRVERAVHRALRGRASFTIDSDTLLLTGPDGYLLHLRAAG